jgi:hypothetical protein
MAGREATASYSLLCLPGAETSGPKPAAPARK